MFLIGGAGHIPYKGYLWGETLGDVTDMKTGEVFYIKTLATTHRALARVISSNDLLYQVNYNGFFKIEATNDSQIRSAFN